MSYNTVGELFSEWARLIKVCFDIENFTEFGETLINYKGIDGKEISSKLTEKKFNEFKNNNNQINGEYDLVTYPNGITNVFDFIVFTYKNNKLTICKSEIENPEINEYIYKKFTLDNNEFLEIFAVMPINKETKKLSELSSIRVVLYKPEIVDNATPTPPLIFVSDAENNNFLRFVNNSQVVGENDFELLKTTICNLFVSNTKNCFGPSRDKANEFDILLSFCYMVVQKHINIPNNISNINFTIFIYSSKSIEELATILKNFSDQSSANCCIRVLSIGTGMQYFKHRMVFLFINKKIISLDPALILDALYLDDKSLVCENKEKITVDTFLRYVVDKNYGETELAQ